MIPSSSRSVSVSASAIVPSVGSGDGERRRLGQVVRRQEAQQLLDVAERVGLVLGQVVRDPGLGVVRPAAAELLEVDLLAGHRPDHVRAGDEHVTGVVDHHGEVGDRRGVHRPARARPHDQRDLRDHPGAAHVAHEDLAVEPERDHPLLDPRAAAVVDPDHRAADLGGQVHHLDDLLAVHLAERAAEHGGVLAEHRDRAAVDGAGPGDHAVAERPAWPPCRSWSSGAGPARPARRTSRGRAAARTRSRAVCRPLSCWRAIAASLSVSAAPRRCRSASLPAVVWMSGSSEGIGSAAHHRSLSRKAATSGVADATSGRHRVDGSSPMSLRRAPRAVRRSRRAAAAVGARGRRR